MLRRYLPDEYPWIIAEDIAHGVHYNGILGDVFAGFSVENDGDYQKLLELTDAIPSTGDGSLCSPA